MLLKTETVKFVEGNVGESKSGDTFAVVQLQYTLGSGEKQFTKIEKEFIMNPAEEVVEFVKNAKMGDEFTAQIHLT